MGVSHVRASIRAPLPQVWEFLIKPENMHVWGPPTRPVTGFDRPLQAGDRVTLYRRDFLMMPCLNPEIERRNILWA
jgi:ligand-binding SRPBCC domain-containing protein